MYTKRSIIQHQVFLINTRNVYVHINNGRDSPLGSVGAGSAGSVVAGRLAEVPWWRVLVLEAGGPPPPESYVPGLAPLASVHGNNNWNYITQPQEHGLGNFVDQVGRGVTPQGDVTFRTLP